MRCHLDTAKQMFASVDLPNLEHWNLPDIGSNGWKERERERRVWKQEQLQGQL